MGSAIQKFYYGDAERKASLGRDWHPTCLRCVECGRVLSPGNHAEGSKEPTLADVMSKLQEVKTQVKDMNSSVNSKIDEVKQEVCQLRALQRLVCNLEEKEEEDEHKGNPYCHTPCYNALFGPSLLGYGSNLASPANFAKKDNAAEYGHDYDDDVYKREIYSNSRSAAAAARRQRQRQSAPPSIVDGHNVSPVALSAGGSPAAVPGSSSSGGRGGRGVALSSTQSADNLGRVVTAGRPRYGGDPNSVVNSGSLATTSSSQSSSSHPGNLNVNDVGSATTSSNSKPISNSSSRSAAAKRGGSGHSRSKSDQVLSVDDRPGSFVVVDGSGGGGGGVVPDNRPLTTVNQSPSINSRSSSANPSSSSSSSTSGTSAATVMQQTVLPVSGCLIYEEIKRNASPTLRDILEKVESFNSHFEGKVHHQMTVDQNPGGEVKVRGPLRIYWGLSRPIQLSQCDDVPAPPISKWRHSLCANLNEGMGQTGGSLSQKFNPHRGPGFQSPNRPLRGIDDSVLLSPSSADEVVMRRQKVRKFNTVAYRSDAPTKWKRASINGHIFNYDTSVFIPVLGSSTTVIADSSMTSPVVIKTLLEKFKVENSPGEYVLSVVTEKGDHTQEHLLEEGERPLLERLALGADDQYAKIFLKERIMEPTAIVPGTVKLPIMEEEEEETLPAEVEQLMILPVAVLKGIMVKYEKDEEKDVRMMKAKYERVKRKIRQRLEDLKTA